MERFHSVIERYHLREVVTLADQPLVISGRPSDPVKLVPVDRSFLDQEALADESTRFSTNLRHALERARKAPIVITTEREGARWAAVHERVIDLAAISDVHVKTLQAVEAGEVEKDHMELALYHNISLGTELTMSKTIAEELSMAQRVGQEAYYLDYVALMEFSSAAMSSIKIDGISLADFADPKISKKSSVPYFQFLLIATMAAHRKLYDQILADNLDTLAPDYPNMARWNINVLPNKVLSLTAGVDPKVLSTRARNIPHPLSDAYLNAAKLVEGVNAVRSNALQALLNPQSPDSEPLRNLVEIFLDSSLNVDRVYTLHMLGLNNLSKIYSVYRKAYELASGEQGEFYLKLAMSIRVFLEDISTIKDVLNDEDIDTFLSPNGTMQSEEGLVQTQLSLQAQTINTLTNITSQRSFEIDPTTIDTGHLIRPQIIEVHLDANRPRKYTINLAYFNKLEEEVEVEYTIDTSKNTFEWNLLEDPNKPESSKISIFRDELTLLASKLLTHIRNEEASKKQARAQSTQAPIPQIPTPKRERFEDPVYTLRKQVREERKKQIKEESEANQVDIHIEPESKQIKKVIVLPDPEEIAELLKQLSTRDAEIVLQAIAEYNENGTGGKFSRKTKVKLKEPRYTLSVGCTVPAGARVLLKETESASGIRTFEIIDIRYRKDIYSENPV